VVARSKGEGDDDDDNENDEEIAEIDVEFDMDGARSRSPIGAEEMVEAEVMVAALRPGLVIVFPARLAAAATAAAAEALVDGVV
jgi:hypothetical protein